jgi:hypothetical protein
VEIRGMTRMYTKDGETYFIVVSHIRY